MSKFGYQMSDWHFDFPNYVSMHTVRSGQYRVTSTYKLFFVTYWLIRLLHGKDELKRMSARNYLKTQGIAQNGPSAAGERSEH